MYPDELKKKNTENLSVDINAARLKAHRIIAGLYLAERRYVSEGSILNDLISLAGVAQLGVALHGLGGQADTCGLAAGGIRRVPIVVPLEDHQLTLSLGDVCGERLQDVAKRHIHLCFQLSTWRQTGGQLHFVKLPAVTKKTLRKIYEIHMRIFLKEA